MKAGTMTSARFTYAFDDYVEARRAWLKHGPVGYRLMSHSMVISGGLLILLGIILAYSEGSLWLMAGCFAYGIFLLVYHGIFGKARLRSAFRNARNFKGENIMETDEEQFEMRGSDGESKMFWHAFSGYFETENVFILTITASRPAYVIPKRAFPGSEVEAVRQLLARRIVRTT